MDRHFRCTGCGKCCYGLLPLTLKDAIANAGRFPLAVLWTPVRQGSKSFALTGRLGTVIRIAKHKELAVRIAPTAYIPASLPCPMLQPDGLCGIHDAKPTRCRTMPFSAYREEADQGELLVPRPGWDCDTSDDMPAVYRDKAILDRADFAAEREELSGEAPILRAYADWLLASLPPLRHEIEKAASKPTGGYVVVKFSSLFPRLPELNVYEFAARQYPVLESFAARTAHDPKIAMFHNYYTANAEDLRRLSERRT